ncbi:MAG TPA: DUF5320 domain-containing protein [Candidatus Hydrogenedentes bacterium]|nr:DUF5320 domain-containing protein [Candidatus Hydrogenedentota bacterium]
MPRGDRTGPLGMGPKTGRAAGFCAGNDRPGFMNPAGGGMGFGRGAGCGGGRGRGRRNMFLATGLPGWQRFGAAPAVAPETETQLLREQANALTTELEKVLRRLEALCPKAGEK